MLARMQKSMKEKDQGFTLIELLVVIVIIGIPVFLTQRKKGVDASLKSDLKSAATAAETVATDDPTGSVAAAGTAYYTITGAVPSNIIAAGFKKSPGNVVTIKGSPTVGYCIKATNTGSSGGTAAPSWYDSGLGGLQPASATTPSGTGSVCSAAASSTGPEVTIS